MPTPRYQLRVKYHVTFLLLGAIAFTIPAYSAEDEQWIATWAAAPSLAGPPMKPQTIRQIIRTSLGGSRLRIRLSNLFGTKPVNIGPVHIAIHKNDSAIQPKSDNALTFGGKSTVTIAKGESVLSDPVNMEVAPLQELAVSLYLPRHTGPTTIHDNSSQTTFITKTGNATAAEILPEIEINENENRFFLTDVEVASNPNARAIVIFGDSIANGNGSTADDNSRWPDVLATRLQADKTLASIAVVNAGIGGNRILMEGSGPFTGPSALSRFDRDALSKSGVRWILVHEGINDIIATSKFTSPKVRVSAQQIIDGMKLLIARAHNKGLRIWGATLLPFRGELSHSNMFEVMRETKQEEIRQMVNSWIRIAGVFDAVIDFDKVIRDPIHTYRLLPAFDSGDHLHPNDAGYAVMAESFDLRLLSQDK